VITEAESQVRGSAVLEPGSARPELATDERFADFAARRRNADELLAVLDAVFLSRTAEKWLDALRAAGVPCGPVNTVREALSDAQTIARGVIVETAHPRFGTVRQVRSPVRVGHGDEPYRRAPKRHEDADDVLRRLLGYDDRRIDELGRRGAFGKVPE
jgi:crotonobetainyl-CoA:carnitine CoA-transferase CaiB-like acyl-CoA transferase